MRINDFFKKLEISDSIFLKIFQSEYFGKNIKTFIDSSNDYKEFISKIEDVGVLMYHASDFKNEYFTMKVAKRDKPKNTYLFIHNYINEYSKKQIGIDVRNLFYAYKDEPEAAVHNKKIYMVFPLYGFTALFNPFVENLYVHYGSGNNNIKNTVFSFKKELIHALSMNLNLDGSIIKNLNFKKILNLENKAEVIQEISKELNEHDNMEIIKKSLDQCLDMFIEYVDNIKITKNINKIGYHNEIMLYMQSCFMIEEKLQFKFLKLLFDKYKKREQNYGNIHSK